MTRLLILILSIVAMASPIGCKKKPPETESTVVAPPPPPPPAPAPPEVQEMVKNFERVFFDFDSSSLDDQSKSALKDNATIMSEHTDIKLEIQGHADERGTTDYNLALGQRRANAVLNFLSSNGVASSRLKVVSYGEERPLSEGHSETAWAQNRRAEFIITYKSADEPVKGTNE
jgi:peptidoglycan-associated lipoprotein